MPQNKSNTHAFFKGVSVQSIFTIILGILEILVFSIMSRLLTKTDFGYYAVLTGVTIVFTSISNAGIGSALIQRKNPSREFTSCAFTLCCITSIFMTSIFFMTAPLFAGFIGEEDLVFSFRLMAITLLVCSINSYGISVLYKRMDFKHAGMLKIAAYVISSVIGIYLATKGHGAMALVIMLILRDLLTTLFLYAFYVNIPKFGINKKDAKEILSFGGWLTLGVIASNISGQLDKFFLPRWLSVQTLGAYNRPSGFVANITNHLNNIFDSVLFPSLSSIQDDILKVKVTFLRATSLLNTFAVVLFLMFFLNAEIIIRIFFGEKWIDLVPVLQIISFGTLFVMANTLADCFYRGLNFVKIGFYIRFIGCFVCLLFIYVGCKFGIQGVAIALLLYNSILVLVKIVILCKKVNLSIFEVVKTWTLSWKHAVLPFTLGLVFFLLDTSSIWDNIALLICFLVILFIEFIFFPQMVSREYVAIIYPYITSMKNKFFNHRF